MVYRAVFGPATFRFLGRSGLQSGGSSQVCSYGAFWLRLCNLRRACLSMSARPLIARNQLFLDSRISFDMPSRVYSAIARDRRRTTRILRAATKRAITGFLLFLLLSGVLYYLVRLWK